MSIDISSLPAATGYATKEVYYGTSFIQGGRTNYLLDLSLLQIISLVPRPNPAIRTVGNRRITAKHASDFATYLRKTPEWVVPGIILRTDSKFDFESATDATSGVAFGAISYQRSATRELHILDGQHRILGMHEALDGINADIDKINELISTARRNEDPNSIRDFSIRKEALEAQAKRFTNEHIPVQIMVEADRAKFLQAFFDIAENAKGITASIRAQFDSRQAVNRALEEILDHPLLETRTDTDIDRLPKTSPHITTAKHVIETVRALTVGYEGRIGKRVEATLSDRQIMIDSRAFFDELLRAFPPLQAILNGQITADKLRKTSLLGSPIFWRILAAVHHDLIAEHSFTPEMVEQFFEKLAPHLEVPIHENSLLFEQIGMPSFIPTMSAPSSRRQDAVFVVESLVGWAIDKPKFLDAKPKPRPKVVELHEDDMTEAQLDAMLRPETARAKKGK
jgi:hypothetical protein